ncbi:MAG: hypothetical protein ABI867_32575 [Kofleriaceae bacterium]
MLVGEVVVLIEAALQFPTVVFTIGLGITLFYWLFVLLGALDIDLFGHHGDVGDAVTGGAKAGAEAIGHGDGHDVGDVDTGGVWSGLGLSKVPITISVSAIFLVCWVLSLAAMYYLPDLLGSWVGPVILPVALLVGLPIAGLLVRPLGGVFELREGKSNKDYIGHMCTITTGKVDDGFGQATIEDGGAFHIIAVRCDRSDVLARGHKALIIDFDSERDAFVVEPVTDMLSAEGSSSSSS